MRNRALRARKKSFFRSRLSRFVFPKCAWTKLLLRESFLPPFAAKESAAAAHMFLLWRAIEVLQFIRFVYAFEYSAKAQTGNAKRVLKINVHVEIPWYNFSSTLSVSLALCLLASHS